MVEGGILVNTQSCACGRFLTNQFYSLVLNKVIKNGIKDAPLIKSFSFFKPVESKCFKTEEENFREITVEQRNSFNEQ